MVAGSPGLHFGRHASPHRHSHRHRRICAAAQCVAGGDARRAGHWTRQWPVAARCDRGVRSRVRGESVRRHRVAGAAGHRRGGTIGAQGTGPRGDRSDPRGHGRAGVAGVSRAPADHRGARARFARWSCPDGAAAGGADGRGRGGQCAWTAGRVHAGAYQSHGGGRRQRGRVLRRRCVRGHRFDPAHSRVSRAERHPRRTTASRAVGDPHGHRGVRHSRHASVAARPLAPAGVGNGSGGHGRRARGVGRVPSGSTPT